MRSDRWRHIARSPSSIDSTICRFSLWRLLCCCYFLGWTELFGTPSQSHLAMDAPQLRAQLASVGILLDQWLTWEFYGRYDKQAAVSFSALTKSLRFIRFRVDAIRGAKYYTINIDKIYADWIGCSLHRIPMIISYCSAKFTPVHLTHKRFACVLLFAQFNETPLHTDSARAALSEWV